MQSFARLGRLCRSIAPVSRLSLARLSAVPLKGLGCRNYCTRRHSSFSMCGQTPDAAQAHRVLLPDLVVPDVYKVHLTPDLDQFTFTGTETVECTVRKSTDRFTVHAKELLISSEVTFTPSGGCPVEAKEVILNKKETTVTFVFPEELPEGKGELKLDFSGTLNDQMAGFYRSGYTDSYGNKRFLATTQMEAIDCRRAFPCWDEPAVKAVFEISLTVPAHLMALSNMPEAERTMKVTEDGKGLLQTVRFLPSPCMSSYLVAMCVGEFEFLQGRTKSGTLVRVLCTPGKAKNCKFALDVGIKSLDFYEEFFDVAYPLPKMDMIAIPDFAMGAMENWGLVTYREIDLLCDEETVSMARKTRLATVVTHELAHQWFGNLVTMRWWDDLWLNEGFANWMQTHCADHIFPHWNMWEQYVCEDQERALSLDALRSSHPIQVPIPRAEDVEQVFDAISYCKGGSVVRMLFSVLGEELFRKGLQLYMKRHKYGNTETTDLWNAFAEVSKMPIGELMASWTNQMGFPVVTASSSSPVKVSQKWFLADGSEQEGDEKKKWVLPLITGQQGMDGHVPPVSFLKEAEGEVQANTAGWVKLNYGQHIPMRVMYTPENWEKLSKAIAQQDASLPPIDRIGLLYDAMALAKNGTSSLDEVLTLLSAFKEEKNVNVWEALETVFAGLSKLCENLGRKDELSALASSLIVPRLSELGWDQKEGDSDADKRLRAGLLRLSVSFCADREEVKKEARRRFAEYERDPKTKELSDESRPSVFKIVLKTAETEEEGHRLWTLLKNQAESPQFTQTEKLNIYVVLGYAKYDSLKKKTLDWCLSPSLKNQDFFYPMRGVKESSLEGQEVAWKWIQANFESVYSRVKSASPSLLQAAVICCSGGAYQASRAKEIEGFLYGNEGRKAKVKSITRGIDQVCEAIRSNAAFLERAKKSKAAQGKDAWPKM